MKKLILRPNTSGFPSGFNFELDGIHLSLDISDGSETIYQSYKLDEKEIRQYLKQVGNTFIKLSKKKK